MAAENPNEPWSPYHDREAGGSLATETNGRGGKIQRRA